jgi:hypothetical protein
MNKPRIEPDKMYRAPGNYVEILIPGQAILDCSHSGRCDEDVSHWGPKIERYPFGENHHMAPTPERLRQELKEYGAWNAEELQDDAANWERFIWIISGSGSYPGIYPKTLVAPNP